MDQLQPGWKHSKLRRQQQQVSSTVLSYNISSIHWNNWFSLPGDMLAVCDELGNMTMLITGQRPDRATTYEKLTMVFQDNVYKIYNHVMPLKPVDKLKPMNIERKQTRKEYNTSILEFRWLTSLKSVIVSQFCDLIVVLIHIEAEHSKCLHMVCTIHLYKICVLGNKKNGQIDFWYQFSNSKDHKKITLQLLDTSNQRFKGLQWLELLELHL
ncbi:CMF_collapsed_G0045310.mRNA.1.CDS.1 [Saccharomyces cerevisiae]|nr:CMF_collapsed_G0045310.mRNA.1.CDS.1 [Saccharomyces cerevisiae]